MTRLFGRACVAALVGALLGLMGPGASVLAEDDARAERTHARATRTKKRIRSGSARRTNEPTSDVEESERTPSESPPDERTTPERNDPPPSDNDEEVISDPEMKNGPPTPTSKRIDDGADEVFSDPELEENAPRGPRSSSDGQDDNGWGEVYKPTVERAAGPREREVERPDPMANTGLSRLAAYGQFGSDIHHEGNLEDAYETRLRFDAEVEFRRSKKLRLSIGVRTDLLWALPARGDDDLKAARNPSLSQDSTALKQGRFELDILPTSAFIDVTPANGFHMRIGEQQVSIARMDFYSAIDMLAAYDLRGQIGLGQSTGKLAQPAVRIDWDLSSWATLQMVYLPWFMPDLVRPNRDRYVARELGTSGGTPSPSLSRLVEPGFQTKANEDALRFVGPTPDFTTPQAQARLNMRGSGFEIALSAGSALEKLPSFYTTPVLEKYLSSDQAVSNGAKGTVFGNLDRGIPEVDVAYHRYELIALDGSVDLAPLNLGFELAFSPSRHLVAATFDAAHLPQPNTSQMIADSKIDFNNVTDKSIRKGVPLIQGAVHLDWLKGERFAIAVEGFFVQALKLPYDKGRDWWGFIEKSNHQGTGLYAGGVLGATYRPDSDNGRWRFDGSVVGLVGPSIIVMPQVEYHALDTLYLNIGAQLFEGPIPKDAQGNVVTGGAQSLNVGGLFSGYDQVYAGFRYVP